VNQADRNWAGSARFGIGWGLFEGLPGDNQPHAHHALQLVLSQATQQVWTVEHEWHASPGLLIGAGVRHQLGPAGSPLLLLYLDAQSACGRALSAAMPGASLTLNTSQVSQLWSILTRPDQLAPDQQLCAYLLGEIPHLPPDDPLMDRLLTELDARITQPVRAQDLAAAVGLSSSRLLHRFRDHTGLPLRPYVRWRRLLRALQALLAGVSITQAAVDAGFADAAHLTRTCRRHFGITPRKLDGTDMQT
jgi:AraC-like DNA-binding protein